MPLVSLVRGFKLSVDKLDNFLHKHHLPVTMGTRIWPKDMMRISEVFQVEGVDCAVEIFQAGRLGFDDAQHVFVCCDWIRVFASQRVDAWLAELATKPVPASFSEHLRRTLLGAGDGVIGIFVVFNENNSWAPQQLLSDEGVSFLHLPN